jgi:hypothetical protein
VRASALQELEEARQRMAPLYPPPAPFQMTAGERAVVEACLASLDALLSPARNDGPKLDIVIGKLFAAFNVYTDDTRKLRAQLEVWGARRAPPLGILQAVRWAVQHEEKLPSISSFLGYVPCAIGDETQKRKRMLRGLLA